MNRQKRLKTDTKKERKEERGKKQHKNTIRL